ncbi:GAF domain-containing protein [Tepidibacter hydrothermalis]|uniref:GAF domain-containing protein n=1 Tax=Tepidibacter hydrothermalis TaxID=3036126 RepID=A0ABY8ECH1_9FIRM|nr:GAF domain-containing protein [Tepidibacter hydrothermalis]WFD09289.1 GAF domain-containing protein [Tepidibacter hydrothermalis]
MVKKLEELCTKLYEITKIEDIGYHQISNGKLNPIYKMNTSQLSAEKWKEVHSQKTVYVKNDPVLTEIVSTKKAIVMSDIDDADEVTKNTYSLFGINSIFVIPSIKNDGVDGIVVIASIGTPHNFTDEEVSQCIKLVDKYL